MLDWAGETVTLEWQVGMDGDRARDEVLHAVAGAGGLSVAALDERAVFVARRFLPTWALVAGVAAAPFTGFLSLLLLLWRSDESFVVSLRPRDGGVHVRAHGAVHDRAAARMTERFGVEPALSRGGAR